MTDEDDSGIPFHSGSMLVEDLLPEEMPVFPLTGVLLLPGATLPLNIFEPRYLNMIEDSLGSGRVIGMVQPKTADVESPEGQPDIYETGCAGRIVSFSETGDGRFAINLLGLCRFHIAEELPLRSGYRVVRPDYTPYFEDLDEDGHGLEDRGALLKTVEAYFIATGINAEWSAIEGADDASLVTTLSMLCPFDPSEKQALLECKNTTSRGQLLGNLMTLSLHGNTDNNGVRH